MMLPKTQ